MPTTGVLNEAGHIPLRVATGAYILNSGLSKQGLEGQAAEGLHGMATNAIPALKKIPPASSAIPRPAKSRLVRRC